MAEEDNIEMKDLDRLKEVEEEIAAEEETNIDDDDRDELLVRKKQNLRTGGERRDPNVSITFPQGFNPDIEGVPETPKGLKRIFTNDRKIFLKNALNVSLNKGDGPNSTTLFDNLQLTNDQRSGKNNGAKYKGTKIIVVKDGEYKFSTSADKKTRNAVEDFKTVLEKAKIEHGKTAAAEVEEHFDEATFEDVDSILSEVEDQLSDRIEKLQDKVLEIRRGGLTKAEVDALIGVLAFDKTQKMTPEEQIKFLTEAEIPHWKEKLENAKKQDAESIRTKQIEGVVEMMELKADAIRIKSNVKPETDFAKDLIKTESETGDISRLRRFSKWAKENLLGLSAVAISAAGIITSIVIAGRSAIKAGVRGTKKFAKALAEVAKKVAPVLGAVLNLIGSVLTATAKGLDWVSRNLWSLALLIVYVVINGLRKRSAYQTHRRV